MEVTIKIEDYLSQDEIKAIAKEELRGIIRQTYGRDEYNISRLISNLSYEFIFEELSIAIGEDAEKKIISKVKELLENDDSIKYQMWRRKDVWEKTESPAIPILHKAIKDNEWLIRQKVQSYIDHYEFNDVQDAMYEALNQIVYDKVFGKGGEQG